MYVRVPHHKMSPRDHTELIIGVSRAKKRQESFADVQKSVTPQKPSKNSKKHRIFARFLQIFVFGHFFSRQASYGAETLTADRSRAFGRFEKKFSVGRVAKKLRNVRELEISLLSKSQFRTTLGG